MDRARIDAGLLAGGRRGHGASLGGPVRGTPDRRARAGSGHGPPRSAIERDRERATRPRGRAPVSWRLVRGGDGGPRVHARFGRADRGSCAAKPLGAPAAAARRRVLPHPREEHEAPKAARARMADPAWQERHRRRAGVEGTL